MRTPHCSKTPLLKPWYLQVKRRYLELSQCVEDTHCNKTPSLIPWYLQVKCRYLGLLQSVEDTHRNKAHCIKTASFKPWYLQWKQKSFILRQCMKDRRLSETHSLTQTVFFTMNYVETVRFTCWNLPDCFGALFSGQRRGMTEGYDGRLWRIYMDEGPF